MIVVTLLRVIVGAGCPFLVAFTCRLYSRVDSGLYLCPIGPVALGFPLLLPGPGPRWFS